MAVWRAAPEPKTAVVDDAGAFPSGFSLPGPRLQRLLARRGLATAAEVRTFLEPSLADLHPPELLAGLPEAVDRLLVARDQAEKVAIVGDYDVDGVSATAMLLAVFRACGLEAESILPHRMSEGYGFQDVHVERARAAGAQVIVTADCGSRSIEAARLALDQGLSVIITDHHIPGPPHDPGVIEINPNQERCSYPFGELCGAGLAFKLASALAAKAERTIDPYALLRIACLGTIADLVPLTGENRTIAALGLEALGATRSAGLKALIAVSGVRGAVNAGDVGFRLGPRLNAAGRMDAPEPALELLLERDPVRARELAERLDRWNEQRRSAELAVVEEARAYFHAQEEALPRFLMAWSADWHRGVLGIAAGRLAREFHRPTLLLSLTQDGEHEIAVGSGRSVRGVHLHGFLSAFESRFLRFGGHAQAIGISISRDQLEEIREVLQEAAAAWDPEVLVPSYEYEEHLRVEEVTVELVHDLARLEPFGMANRRPLFRLGPLTLASEPRRFGKDHLGLRARDLGGTPVDLVAWRWGERAALFSEPFEVLGHIKLDTYLGRPSVEITDARPATL